MADKQPAKKTKKKPEPGLDEALAHIAQQFGAGTIMRLGDAGIGPVEVISTASLSLDEALGVGGYARGRVVEIYGPEGSGKTTLALHAIAECQRNGGRAAFIDAEHALDPAYAAGVGVDTDELLVSQPDSGEQGLEVTDILVRSGKVDIIVIDSVAALVPEAELRGEMGDTHVGLQARLMSQALRKITASLGTSASSTVIFINQLREKVGVMFGSPETTSGGRALKFYASMRLDVRRIETIKEGAIPVGSRLRVKVVKNKLAAPFRVAEFDLIFGQGINRESELIDLGLLHRLLDKSGAYYSWKANPLGQGKAKSCLTLRERPELAESLREAVVAALHDHRGQPVITPPPLGPPSSNRADLGAPGDGESAAAWESASP